MAGNSSKDSTSELKEATLTELNAYTTVCNISLWRVSSLQGRSTPKKRGLQLMKQQTPGRWGNTAPPLFGTSKFDCEIYQTSSQRQGPCQCTGCAVQISYESPSLLVTRAGKPIYEKSISGQLFKPMGISPMSVAAPAYVACIFNKSLS